MNAGSNRPAPLRGPGPFRLAYAFTTALMRVNSAGVAALGGFRVVSPPHGLPRRPEHDGARD
jgi:hypothetical protein